MLLNEAAKNLLEKHHFAIVSTIDREGAIHTSAKAVLEVDEKGRIFLLDIYKARTYRNIKKNGNITLTLVDERRYKGYSIMGKGRIVKEDALPKKTVKMWHDKVSKRIARRLIRHVKDEVPGHEGIPEARFPLPRYLIEVVPREIVNLAPAKPVSKNLSTS